MFFNQFYSYNNYSHGNHRIERPISAYVSSSYKPLAQKYDDILHGNNYSSNTSNFRRSYYEPERATSPINTNTECNNLLSNTLQSNNYTISSSAYSKSKLN